MKDIQKSRLRNNIESYMNNLVTVSFKKGSVYVSITGNLTFNAPGNNYNVITDIGNMVAFSFEDVDRVFDVNTTIYLKG